MGFLGESVWGAEDRTPPGVGLGAFTRYKCITTGLRIQARGSQLTPVEIKSGLETERFLRGRGEPHDGGSRSRRFSSPWLVTGCEGRLGVVPGLDVGHWASGGQSGEHSRGVSRAVVVGCWSDWTGGWPPGSRRGSGAFFC